MKKNLIVLLLILTSCGSSKIIELGGQAATKGIEVSQKALDIYTTLGEQKDIDKSQQDQLKILVNPDPSTMNLPDTKVTDFSAQLKPRIGAYKKLLAVYQAFALLTDSKYSDKTKEAISALQDSYDSLNKLPDLPESVSSKLPELGQYLTEAIQAKKIKKHNEILYCLSKIYLELWNKDKDTWDQYIDMVYNSYAEGLNTVESKRYDAGKISDNNNDPYSGDATVILMYRLNVRDGIIKNRNDLKKQLDDFGKALEELVKAHSEIAKEKTDITSVISSINKIEELLKSE